MSVQSASNLLELLSVGRFLAPDQLALTKRDLLKRFRDPLALAMAMVQRGWLTVFQVNRIFQGGGRDLLLGPFRILDRLGEGGLSDVYRAWDSEHRCVVALKVLRKELFQNPLAVGQFEKEMLSMAQLSHPNIVETFDAGDIDGVQYIAMEFIEGIDLGALVRLSGPLGVVPACDYSRQAALGLEHAHEHCLVHRDIKPANLILVTTSAGDDNTPLPGSVNPRQPPAGSVVKIIDWGLADMRLPAAAGKQEPANEKMRQENVGTADYMAPEQAENASRSDIRADIYSLGCTLYYLLSGQPPFPGGSLLQKLLKHREADPTPLEEFRQDLPAGLTDVVSKMMAKKPRNRYRSPASAVVALASFCRLPRNLDPSSWKT